MALKILLIDGDAQSRKVYAKALRDLGFTVSTAKDGPTGMRVFKHEPPDLLISNLVLGEMTAVEVCEKVRATPQAEKAGIILISNSKRSQKYIDGLKERYKVFGFLQKPFEIGKLTQMVDGCVQQLNSETLSPQASGPNVATDDSGARVTFSFEKDKEKQAETKKIVLPKYFPGLLLHYLNQKTTGILKLKKEKHEKSIFFENGVAVGVNTNVRHEHLGPVLIDKGVINEDDYLKAARMMVEDSIPLGQALVQLGALKEGLLAELLQDHQVIKVAKCFLWLDAQVKMEEKETLPNIKNKGEISLEKIFEEGQKTLKKVKKLEQILKPLAQSYLKTTSLFEQYKNLLKLSDKDLTVLEQVKSGYQLEEILNENNQALFSSLYLSGMLAQTQPNIEILMRRLNDLKSEVNQKNQGTEEELAARQKELEKLIAEKNEAANLAKKEQEEAEKKEKALLEAQGELDKAQQQLEETQRKMQEIEEKNKELAEKFQSDHAQNENLQKEIEDLRAKAEELNRFKDEREKEAQDFFSAPAQTATTPEPDPKPMGELMPLSMASPESPAADLSAEPEPPPAIPVTETLAPEISPEMPMQGWLSEEEHTADPQEVTLESLPDFQPLEEPIEEPEEIFDLDLASDLESPDSLLPPNNNDQTVVFQPLTPPLENNPPESKLNDDAPFFDLSADFEAETASPEGQTKEADNIFDLASELEPPKPPKADDPLSANLTPNPDATVVFAPQNPPAAPAPTDPGIAATDSLDGDLDAAFSQHLGASAAAPASENEAEDNETEDNIDELAQTLSALESASFTPEDNSPGITDGPQAHIPVDPFAPANVVDPLKAKETEPTEEEKTDPPGKTRPTNDDNESEFDDFFALPK